ncbi:MAG: preprotein translocase subunit SecG, partial [Alphaproteobacteria bacterium]|nr:preprotein translocase subunit SecG [Alphaproteobacteria bacterium]
MNLLLMVAHVLICVVLIGLVLIQQGKGADSAFGGGASSTVFGSQGSTSFIVKTTALIAFLF